MFCFFEDFFDEIVPRALKGCSCGSRSRGCSTVVLIGFTCPAITVGTVILRALVRVHERALGGRSAGKAGLRSRINLQASGSVCRFIGLIRWTQEP